MPYQLLADAVLLIHFGVVLFVVSGVTQVPMRELVKSAWPFITLMYAVLALCIFFPAIVTTLPRALGY
mgnify:CR=1 FL=1